MGSFGYEIWWVFLKLRLKQEEINLVTEGHPPECSIRKPLFWLYIRFLRCWTSYRTHFSPIRRTSNSNWNAIQFQKTLESCNCNATNNWNDNFRNPLTICRGLSGLVGQNRLSPIASVQRTQSTLTSHSAMPCGTNVKRMNANRAIRIAAQRAQGLWGLVSVFSREIWPPTNASDSSRSDSSR